MPSAGISIIWGGIAASAVTAVASFATALIARQIKISEFRQTWIGELRKDIADYSGAAERWLQKYTELNQPNPDHDEKVRRQRAELMPIANEALVILRRIRLRFNARDDNPDKAEDDALLASLEALIDPAKLNFSRVRRSWDELADDAVARGRAILKREWEVTKHPLWHRVKRYWIQSRPHLAAVGHRGKTRWKGAYEQLRHTFFR